MTASSPVPVVSVTPKVPATEPGWSVGFSPLPKKPPLQVPLKVWVVLTRPLLLAHYGRPLKVFDISVRGVFTRWIGSSMGSPPPTEMLSIVPSMLPAMLQPVSIVAEVGGQIGVAIERRHPATRLMMGPDCGTAIRRFTFESFHVARGERLSTRCDGPEGIVARIVALSYFIQPDTEEEVVFLLSSCHSRNAFPASGKRVAGRGRDHDIVPAARINQ